MACTVSIIICTANKPESLTQTLLSLSQCTIPRSLAVELIVVDNKPDSARQAVESFSPSRFTTRYVREPKAGKSHALNCGLAVAEGNLIVITDDDLRFSFDWLAKLIEPILQGKADGVAGAIVIAPHLERKWMTELHRGFFAELIAEPPWDLLMYGANMAFHRRVLKIAPEFDLRLGPSKLGFHEDKLFSLQVRAGGYRLVFKDDAIAVHHFDERRLSRGSLINEAIQRGRSSGYIDHHWDHKRISGLGMRILRKQLQVQSWRLKFQKSSPDDEGCPDAYLWELMTLAAYQQFKIECRSETNYPRRLS